MKYVMFRCEHRNMGLVQLVPVIFPEFMVHADADKYVGHWMRRVHDMKSCKPASAGTIELGGRYSLVNGKVAITDGPMTHGESETLCLKSRPEDADIIAMYNYTNGLV